jgi:hypothetical protein
MAEAAGAKTKILVAALTGAQPTTTPGAATPGKEGL